MTSVTERQKSDKYNQLLNETLEASDHMKKTAERTIPEMWYELIALGFNKDEARQEVEKDLQKSGKWGPWSIIKFLPDEAKVQGRRIGGWASAGAREARKKEKLEQTERTGEVPVILEEKVTKQIFLLYVDGKRRMIVENEEVKALD
jgi:hypothetical protein